MLQVSLKRQLRNMSEVASGECQCVCVCVTDCQCYTSHCTTLYEDIQKAKQNLMQCLLEHVGAMKCNEDLLQKKNTTMAVESTAFGYSNHLCYKTAQTPPA